MLANQVDCCSFNEIALHFADGTRLNMTRVNGVSAVSCEGSLSEYCEIQ